MKDSAQNSLVSYNYDYSPAGNVTGKNTEQGDYTYQYDDLYRLTGAANPGSNESYTYDPVGNRLTSADLQGDWTYNQNNELTGYDAVSYEYDANGNMISKTDQTGTTTYTYDVDNRLVQLVTPNSQLATYYYDPFGRRLWKDVNGVRTYFFYSDEGLIGEYNASGVEIKTYGYAPNSTWTTNPLFQKIGPNYYWYQNDHLGTPQKIIDSTGAVVWSASYDAFGNANVAVATIENNLRFPGQYYDQESKLHYNYNRYYDSATGRYITPDPARLVGGINAYVYADNRPVVGIDPSGLWVGWIHEEIIRLAAESLNCSKIADKLAKATSGVDGLPNFQDYEHSYFHAMVNGDNPFGWDKDKENYHGLLEKGRKSCSGEDHKFAFHALQDSFAPAHRGFKPWYEGDSYKHWRDLFMTSAAYEAVAATREMLAEIMRNCPCYCENQSQN